MKATDVVRRQGGAMPRAEIMALLGRHRVDAAVAAGELVALRRGLLGLPGLDATAAAARALDGTVSGLSAARYWGWSLKREPARPCITVPRNRPARADGTEVHRQDLSEAEVCLSRTGVRVATPVRTVLDCARSLPFDEALCVADSALRDGLHTGLRREMLLAAVAGSPRTGRSRAERVIGLADPRAANAFESTTRAIALSVPGLRVEPQGDLGYSESGLQQYGDLVDMRLRLLIECESWAYHSGEEPFRRDIRRYTYLVSHGWTVLRFVWEDVMQRPERVRDAIERTVTYLKPHSSR